MILDQYYEHDLPFIDHAFSAFCSHAIVTIFLSHEEPKQRPETATNIRQRARNIQITMLRNCFVYSYFLFRFEFATGEENHVSSLRYNRIRDEIKHQQEKPWLLRVLLRQ